MAVKFPDLLKHTNKHKRPAGNFIFQPGMVFQWLMQPASEKHFDCKDGDDNASHF